MTDPDTSHARPSILEFVTPRPACAPCLKALRAHPSGGATDGGRARRVRTSGDALDPDAARPLAILTTDTGECAEDVEHAPGTPCASRRVLKAVQLFAAEATGEARGSKEEPVAASPTGLLPTATTPEAEAVRQAAAVLGCDSESCVLVHPVFRQYVVEKRVVPEGALDLELKVRYKAAGPRDTYGLLSNFNIDETLVRWARVFPEFFPCPFAMMDFDRTGEPFATINIVDVLEGREAVDLGPGFGVVRRRATCFGCIVNTDYSYNPGKHWVAVFVDCRPPPGEPWTVEYFNSAGNPPPKPMVVWMERTRAYLAKYRAGLPACRGRADCPVATLPVTDVDHQESQTECGLYGLFYTRCRLQGVPISFFTAGRIPDDAMTEFRKHVFRRA